MPHLDRLDRIALALGGLGSRPLAEALTTDQAGRQAASGRVAGSTEAPSIFSEMSNTVPPAEKSCVDKPDLVAAAENSGEDQGLVARREGIALVIAKSGLPVCECEVCRSGKMLEMLKRENLGRLAESELPAEEVSEASRGTLTEWHAADCACEDCRRPLIVPTGTYSGAELEASNRDLAESFRRPEWKDPDPWMGLDNNGRIKGFDAPGMRCVSHGRLLAECPTCFANMVAVEDARRMWSFPAKERWLTLEDVVKALENPLVRVEVDWSATRGEGVDLRFRVLERVPDASASVPKKDVVRRVPARNFVRFAFPQDPGIWAGPVSLESDKKPFKIVGLREAGPEKDPWVEVKLNNAPLLPPLKNGAVFHCNCLLCREMRGERVMARTRSAYSLVSSWGISGGKFVVTGLDHEGKPLSEVIDTGPRWRDDGYRIERWSIPTIGISLPNSSNALALDFTPKPEIHCANVAQPISARRPCGRCDHIPKLMRCGSCPREREGNMQLNPPPPNGMLDLGEGLKGQSGAVGISITKFDGSVQESRAYPWQWASYCNGLKPSSMWGTRAGVLVLCDGRTFWWPSEILEGWDIERAQSAETRLNGYIAHLNGWSCDPPMYSGKGDWRQEAWVNGWSEAQARAVTEAVQKQSALVGKGADRLIVDDPCPEDRKDGLNEKTLAAGIEMIRQFKAKALGGFKPNPPCPKCGISPAGIAGVCLCSLDDEAFASFKAAGFRNPDTVQAIAVETERRERAAWQETVRRAEEAVFAAPHPGVTDALNRMQGEPLPPGAITGLQKSYQSFVAAVIPATVAGHTFTGLGEVCECGRRWSDIMFCDEGHVGQENIAHESTLSYAELAEIRAKAQRDRERMEAATTHVSKP